MRVLHICNMRVGASLATASWPFCFQKHFLSPCLWVCLSRPHCTFLELLMVLYYIQNQVISSSAFWVPSVCWVLVRTLKNLTACVYSFLLSQTICAPVQSYLFSIPPSLSFLVETHSSSHVVCPHVTASMDVTFSVFIIISAKIDPLNCRVFSPRQFSLSGLLPTSVLNSPYNLLALTIFVSSHSLYWNLTVKRSEVAQSCATPCNSMDCSLPGSPIHGIFQVRVLECVTIPFSRGSSWPGDRTWVSHIASRLFTCWSSREALKGQNFLKVQKISKPNKFRDQ